MPQPVGNADADGVLPNRQWVLWPYTDMASPHIEWGNQFVFIRSALQTDDALKIGYPNPRGWLAYYLEGTLFVKQADFQAEAVYPDYGSSSECYCCARFIELETLGPLTRLAPGESVKHRETWRLFSPVEFSPDEGNAAQLCRNFGLT